jgi:hypothetical protein
MMQAMPFRSSPRAVLSRFMSHVVGNPPYLMRRPPGFRFLALTRVDSRPPPTCSRGGNGTRQRAPAAAPEPPMLGNYSAGAV